MMILLVLTFIFIFFIISGLTIYYIVIADSIFGDLDFSTSQLATAKIVSIIQDHKQERGVLYDLGSCRGIFALRIQKFLPQLKIYGIDNSQFRTFCSRVKSIFLKIHPKFLTADLFKTNVSQADIVYIYLPRELMPRLQNKLRQELKPGALVIINSVSFPDWQPKEIIDLPQDKIPVKKIFVYSKA
jgi:trans-aconitate methyltransferase